MEGTWLNAIGVVKFDVEFGNKLEILYPRSFWKEFSETDIKDIAYLSFPDSTTMSAQNEPSSLYCYRIRNYFVFVYFHQEKHPESPRGYKMESVLLFSKYPFLKLYKKIIRVVAANYFFISHNESTLQKISRKKRKKDEFDLDSSEEEEEESPENRKKSIDAHVFNFFSRVFSEISKWPEIECNHRYRSLPLFKKNYNYKTPMMSIYQHPLHCIFPINGKTKESENKISSYKSNNLVSTPSPSSLPSPSSMNLSFSPHTNRRRNDRRKSVFQNEVNIYHTFKRHLKTLPKLWELLLLNRGPILVLSPSPKYTSETILGLSTLIQPLPDIALDIRPYFTVNCSKYQNYMTVGVQDNIRNQNSSTPKPNTSSKQPKVNGNGKTVILGATNPFFLKAYISWPHLLAIGESAPRIPSMESAKRAPAQPKKQSQPTSLGSFLTPSSLTKKSKESPIILGCSATKKRGISERLMWQFSEMFVTTYKKFVINDAQMYRDMNILSGKNRNRSSSQKSSSPLALFVSYTTNGNRNSQNTNGDSSHPTRDLSHEKLNNENIRRAFHTWTTDFLTPLDECFSQLKKLFQFPLFLKNEVEKVMTGQRFFNYLKKNPNCFLLQKRKLFKKKEAKNAVVLGFYREFITSPNFRCWLNDKINFEYYKTLENVQLKKVVSLMNQVGVMDFFLRVNKDLKVQEKRLSKRIGRKRVNDFIDPKVVRKLNFILLEIISLSPPPLRSSMLSHMEKNM